jgi:hypothetical protein
MVERRAAVHQLAVSLGGNGRDLEGTDRSALRQASTAKTQASIDRRAVSRAAGPATTSGT